MMSPSINHSYVQVALSAVLFNLKQYSVFTGLSIEIEGKEYIPDVCLYSKREIDFTFDVLKMKEMPLLVIEILSPTQLMQELIEKIQIYLNANIQSCWLVVPVARSIMVFNDMKRPKTCTEQVIDDKLNISLSLNEIFTF